MGSPQRDRRDRIGERIADARWTNVGATQPTIGNAAYVGLAVTACNNGTSTTATFEDNVAFTAAASNNCNPLACVRGIRAPSSSRPTRPAKTTWPPTRSTAACSRRAVQLHPGPALLGLTHPSPDHPPASLDDRMNVASAGSVNRSYRPKRCCRPPRGVRWTVFTSDRQYEPITMNVPTSGVTPTTQLWVGAIDDVVSGTNRPEPPAVLAAQSSAREQRQTIRNERAYWVLNACKPTLASSQPPSR